MPSAVELDAKRAQHHQQGLIYEHPASYAARPPSPSPPRRSSSGALLSLGQDITALVSLSVEATASVVNDYVRTALGVVGIGEFVRAEPSRRANESGAGLAVVVVGAADPTGQSLTLRLAKAGYTVFPFVPVAAPSANNVHGPVSAPLSALLLAWNSIQKRLQARDPSHPGAVVPVVIDDGGDILLSSAHAYTTAPPSPPKRSGRFAHAGETVRVYCRENRLSLVAIVCAAPSNLPSTPGRHLALPPDQQRGTISPPARRRDYVNIPGLSSSALASADEEALIALYRGHVLDPLSVVRAVGDMLSTRTGHRGRVLFVETGGSIDQLEPGQVFDSRSGAARMVSAARAEAARLLRSELGGSGIDVCEIVVGPMAPRLVGPMHIRSSSGDSDPDTALAATNVDCDPRSYNVKLLPSPTKGPGSPNGVMPPPSSSQDDVLVSRLRLIARIFAVDDALVYSCVRRAIEDRYPRARHHAGLAPLITSIANATPGVGVVKFLGRWVLGRLFASRRQ